MTDFLRLIQNTPLPSILVVAGIVFWLLAISGSIAGKITLLPNQQRTAGLVGSAFVAIGLMLYFVPVHVTPSPLPTPQNFTTAVEQPGVAPLTSTPATPTAPPFHFALRCRGSVGMASTNGKNLVVEFSKGDLPANQGLQPSQCSFLDRGLRPNEPSRIVDERPSEGEAQHMAELINAGATWTFWITNPGGTNGEFRATASAEQK